MTSMTADTAASPQATLAASRESPPLWLLVPAALLLGLVMSMPRLLAVWHTGTFFDTDDAMRLVQVRNLLAGQSWFDMNIYRLDPPTGVFMHWSRIVDIPLVVLIKFFSIFFVPETAERAARLAFPLALQALLYLGIARSARLLMGASAVVPALLLTLFSGITFGQFQPGRIDHHAPQIVIMIFMTANIVAAFDRKRTRCAAWAGLLAALSLSISIETLPFILAAAGLLVLFWVWWGDDVQRALELFALGLGLGLPVAFVATIAPAHWFDASCDAFSSAYLIPGLAGAGVVFLLGLLSHRLDRRWQRMAAALAGGLVVAGIFAVTRPICLRDPFVGIDPLLREIWLDNVQEAKPLWRLFRDQPYSAATLALPVLLCLIGTVIAALREQGLARQRWIFTAAMGLVGAALSFWMIRVMGFAAPLALAGGAWCIIRLGAALAQTKWARYGALSLVLVLPFSSIGWALALPIDDRDADKKLSADCLTPAALEPIQSLTPGLVAAPIDAGSYLLALTQHKVLAAPYHRNNHGNRAMLDIFLARPRVAETLLRREHVDYVAICAGLGETKSLAKREPNGLAAALLAGHIPDFLLPVLPSNDNPNSLYRVFKMKTQ